MADLISREPIPAPPRHAEPPRAAVRHKLSMFDRLLLVPAMIDALRKLDPRAQWRNPVMFVVYVGSILTTLLWVQALGGKGEAPAWFILNVAIWLWFTVLFANFAEALAEGRSKAQAASLRGLKQAVSAKKLADASDCSRVSRIAADRLRKGDVVLVEAGDYIPADGEVLEGAASVDESAITGESRVRWRLCLRDGRHAIAVRLDRRARNGQSRRDLHRSHDRHGRGCQAPEDTERDRADHPVGCAHPGVPVRDGDSVAILSVQRGGREARHAHFDHCPDCAAGVPHSDDHRRAAVGDRSGRHEPHDAGQCDCHVGARGR